MASVLSALRDEEEVVAQEVRAEHPTILFVTDDDDLRVAVQRRYEKGKIAVGIVRSSWRAGWEAADLAPWVIVIDFAVDDMLENLCAEAHRAFPEVQIVGLFERHQRPVDSLHLAKALRKPIAGCEVCRIVDELIAQSP